VQKRNAYNTFMELGSIRSLRRLRRGWENTIKVDIGRNGLRRRSWIEVAQNREQR
jgi:hypothetical protein